MTVAELREHLSACDPDDLIEMRVNFDGRDYYRLLRQVTSCDIEAVTFLDGGKVE